MGGAFNTPAAIIARDRIHVSLLNPSLCSIIRELDPFL